MTTGLNRLATLSSAPVFKIYGSATAWDREVGGGEQQKSTPFTTVLRPAQSTDL